MPRGRPTKQLRVFGKANHAISEDAYKFIYHTSNTGDSPKVILAKCRHEGMKVSKSTIYNVLKERKEGKTRFATMVEDGAGTRRTVRTKEKISKVAKLINTPDPPTQTQIARKLGTSAAIVNQIIQVKQAVSKRRPTTMRGLWKATQEEFNKIKAPECKKVMNSEVARCKLVEERNGEAIQGLKCSRSSSYVDV